MAWPLLSTGMYFMSTEVQYTDSVSPASNAPYIAGFQPQLTRVSFIGLRICSHGRTDIQHRGNVNIIQYTTIIAVSNLCIHIFSTEN
jgi:hypothetical protein